MNQCQLMGRLVRDPELKYTPQGTAVTSFTLAVDRRFNRDKADYITWDITATGIYDRRDEYYFMAPKQ